MFFELRSCSSWKSSEQTSRGHQGAWSWAALTSCGPKFAFTPIPRAGSQSSTAQDVLWRSIPATKPSRLSMPQREPLSLAERNCEWPRQAKGSPILSARRSQPMPRAWQPIAPRLLPAKSWGRPRQAKGSPIPSTRRLQPVPRAWPPLAPRLLQGSLCQASPDYPDTVRQSRLNPPARGKSGMLPPIEETLGTLPARPQVRCLVIGMTDGLELVCLPRA